MINQLIHERHFAQCLAYNKLYIHVSYHYFLSFTDQIPLFIYHFHLKDYLRLLHMETTGESYGIFSDQVQERI